MAVIFTVGHAPGLAAPLRIRTKGQPSAQLAHAPERADRGMAIG
jgi:hypothetical protein